MRSRDFAETLGHIPSLVHALWWAAMVHQIRRDALSVLEYSKRLLVLGSEHALAQHRIVGSIMHGWALAQHTRFEEGLFRIAGRSDPCPGTQKAYTYFTAMLAETELRAGHFDCAMAALGNAKAIPIRLARPSGKQDFCVSKATSCGCNLRSKHSVRGACR
jgi:adenylate cyclase